MLHAVPRHEYKHYPQADATTIILYCYISTIDKLHKHKDTASTKLVVHK
jgi:hypothetical protein